MFRLAVESSSGPYIKIHWVKFTYIAKETRAVTKAFRNTNVNITFSTNNTISNLLTTRRHITKGKYDNSGIYQLTCPTCSKKYIGQTDNRLKPGSKSI
jgi:chromosome condensin MukBEF complex kleisin-like MukF subunit